MFCISFTQGVTRVPELVNLWMFTIIIFFQCTGFIAAGVVEETLTDVDVQECRRSLTKCYKCIIRGNPYVVCHLAENVIKWH